MLPLAKYRYARKPARRLLEGISRAARPVELEVVVIATADVQDATSALGSLQRARLIRGTSRGQRRFTACHDRVRETVSASLGAQSHRALHGTPARAPERAPNPDPELLAHHLAESGDRSRAAQLASALAIVPTKLWRRRPGSLGSHLLAPPRSRLGAEDERLDYRGALLAAGRLPPLSRRDLLPEPRYHARSFRPSRLSLAPASHSVKLRSRSGRGPNGR